MRLHLQLHVDPGQNAAVELVDDVVGVEGFPLHGHLHHSRIDVLHGVIGVLLEALEALVGVLPWLQQLWLRAK